MIQFRSISHRLIAAIAATVVVACATLGGFSLAQQQAVTGLALDQELRLQYENVIAALDYEGRAAIAQWLQHSMVGLGDWRFPVEFTAIEGDDVVVKWTQIIPGSRPDGSAPTQSGYSRLRYAGDGKFSYEEDVYNMVQVLEDIAQLKGILEDVLPWQRLTL